jgi:voltage-gated potassium channel
VGQEQTGATERTAVARNDGTRHEHRRPVDEAEQLGLAEGLARRLDRPMGVRGVLFLFVVLGQLLAEDPGLVALLNVVGWLFWAVFVGEFLLRAYVAGFSARFWKRNWWQVLFLLLPFLRFVRALQAARLLRLTRLTRAGSVLSAGVRGSRSAGKLLSSRIGWLAAVTGVVVLVSSQLLYVLGHYAGYGPALSDAAMSTVTGRELGAQGGFPRVLEVVLALYSVAVFATLAGSVGAYFLRGETAAEAPHYAGPDTAE